MRSMDKQSNKLRFKQCYYFFSSDLVKVYTITTSQGPFGIAM